MSDTDAMALTKLRDMGFKDDYKNQTVLRQTQGNINAAVEILSRQTPPVQQQRDTSQHALTDDQKLVQLRNMGYPDMAANRDALRRTGGNVDVAVTVLKSNPTPAVTGNNAFASMTQQQPATSLLDLSDPPTMQNPSLASPFQFQQPQQYNMQPHHPFTPPPPQQQQQQHPFAPQQQQQFTPQQQQPMFAAQPQLQFSALSQQPQQQYTMQPQHQSSPFSISSASDPFGQNTLAGKLYSVIHSLFFSYLAFSLSQ